MPGDLVSSELYRMFAQHHRYVQLRPELDENFELRLQSSDLIWQIVDLKFNLFHVCQADVCKLQQMCFDIFKLFRYFCWTSLLQKFC
ncbi:hypothetical protein CHS0354_008095 [Potamilus streckersoni]|uniref:Uncharacterized protein n=1 Tax=Potamilus streckersoni TaxID=2493646 RepID=A0AAE0SZK8_9BIVA|nr:hypothetical protein CHS0354_008095 [Potamilus streckersoni]